MFNLICKSIFKRKVSVFRANYSSSSSVLLSNSNISSVDNNKGQSFTVNYLINSCGLSSESALKASKYINFESSDKPNLIIDIFLNHGFSKTQITNIVRKHPGVLLCNHDKTLLPKFEFFGSKGIKGVHLVKMVSKYPYILKSSLEKQIAPSFNFFSEFFGSEAKVRFAAIRYSYLLMVDVEDHVVPFISTLRESGVPDANIANLITCYPRLLRESNHGLKEIVQDVKKLGFDPLMYHFALGIMAFIVMSKSTFQKKITAYKNWGLSEDQINAAFVRCPWCLMASEEKITSVMDFVVNSIGLDASYVAQNPVVITFSLKKRIVPRWSVAQVLISKRLVENFSLLTLLCITEDKFLDKFVNCHKKEAAKLLKLYRKKLDQVS